MFFPVKISCVKTQHKHRREGVLEVLDLLSSVLSARITSVTVISVLRLHPAPSDTEDLLFLVSRTKTAKVELLPERTQSHRGTQKRRGAENRDETKFLRSCRDSDSPGT